MHRIGSRLREAARPSDVRPARRRGVPMIDDEQGRCTHSGPAYDLFGSDVYPKSGAVLSADGRFRYMLTREWQIEKRSVVWIMLNPSTADHKINDPTIRKIIAYSKRWGYDRLDVANLFGFRTPDPRLLAREKDPVGAENDFWLRFAVERSDLVVCAWGSRGTLNGRATIVRRILREMGVTPSMLRANPSSGEPGHPLYLPGKLEPVPFERPL